MHETIAVVFDFDDTLSPDTTSGFIAQAGLNPATFWNETVNPLYEQGWVSVHLQSVTFELSFGT